MSLSNLGLPFTDGEASSSARKNATMVMTGTGAQIAAIPTSQQIGIFKCLDNSGGLNADEIYFKSASGLQLINFRRKHLHNAATDIAGGLLLEQLIYNPRIVQFGYNGFISTDQFVYTLIGNATFSEFFNNSIGRFGVFNSPFNGVTGDYVNATVMLGGIGIGFSEKILGFIKLVMDFQTNQIARIGFGMEEVQNTIDSTRKMGMEMCPSTGINFQSVTANGISRTALATSMPASTYPTYKNYRMFFNPTNASVKISNNDGVLKIVTSNIPSGGQIDPVRTFRMGLQTTNSQVKNLYISMVKFTGNNNSTDFFDSPE